jgi:glucosamine-6-phosphate deaminase
MRVIVRSDYDAMSEWAAHYVAHAINDFSPDRKNRFVLGLPTGSTPLEMYRILVQLHNAGIVSFEHVVVVNMVEYIGIPPEHPMSYHSYIREHLFRHIDLPEENIVYFNGDADDPESECDEYEERIERLGGMHLFIGGIGPDGHIAYNEPGSSFQSRTRVIRLREDTIRANARFFSDDPGRVPRKAMTLGIATIMDAEEVMILISGFHKAQALQQVVEEGVNHMWTVSCLQLHPNSIIVCDEPATYELKVGTVRYFEQVEREQADLPSAGGSLHSA